MTLAEAFNTVGFIMLVPVVVAVVFTAHSDVHQNRRLLKIAVTALLLFTALAVALWITGVFLSVKP